MQRDSLASHSSQETAISLAGIEGVAEEAKEELMQNLREAKANKDDIQHFVSQNKKKIKLDGAIAVPTDDLAV